MNTTEITIKASISANRTKTWDFYTNPEHITKWNFASDDWMCPSAQNDLKVGGIYKARMEAKDGSFGFDFEAVYTELSEPESFTYELADGRQVAAFFNDTGDKTEVVITFDAENENPVEMQRNGWQSILNNFKKYVEAS